VGIRTVMGLGIDFSYRNFKNIIKISKQSALTVSQQTFKINQQLEIGTTGLALAGLCQ